MNIFDLIIRLITSILFGIIAGAIIIVIIQMIINSSKGLKKENFRKYSYLNGPFCIAIILVLTISCFLSSTRRILWGTDIASSTFMSIDLIIRLVTSLLFGFIAGAIIIAIIETTIYSPRRLKNENFSHISKLHWISIISILTILCFLNFTRRIYWGTDTIGSFFEKNEYTAQYYVNLFSEENSSNKIKADIRSTIIYGVPYTDSNGFEFKPKRRVYYIEKAYLGNDDYRTFFESNKTKGVYNTLRLGEKIKIKDDEGKDWLIELTKEKAD